MEIVCINKMTEGLFGMVILFIFEILPLLENNKIDISSLKWHISTKNYGDIFPNILKYNFKNNEELSMSVPTKSNIVQLDYLRSLQPQYVLGDNFSKLHHLFFKYFTIPKELNEIADKLDLQNFVGIHFRGTDKTDDNRMNTPCSKTDFLIIIDEYIKVNGIKKIFIATDEHYIIDNLKNKYHNIIFKYSRDFTDNIFWRNNPDKEKNAKFAMVDMLCLSKCKEVIKVSSALSAFSKIINPNLKIFRVNALKMFADIPYFPDAYIPLLDKDSNYSTECNNILEKIQLNDWNAKSGKNFNNFYYKIR